jgi:ketosteroid isomerase-like protein
MATPSSEERLALARQGMEAFNRRDLQGMLSLLDEEVEVFASSELVNAGTFHGHDGFTTWIATWVDAWESLDNEVTDNRLAGDRHVVTVIHQAAKGRDGIEVSMDVAFLFDVNERGLCPFLALVPTPEEAERIALERESRT